MIYGRFLAAALLLIGAEVLHAQTPAVPLDPSRTSQSLRPDVTAQPLLREAKADQSLAAENNFMPETPGDSDLGQQLILKRSDRYKAFGVTLDSAEFFTNNVANVHKGAQSDWFYVGGANLSWQPKITNRLYGDASVGEHWFRYGRYDSLDYEDGEAGAGVILLMPELWNTIWHLHYYYERITQGIDNTPIYESHNVRFGGQRTVIINRHHSINLALQASWALSATPETLQRHEYSFAAGWNYKILHNLFFNTSYRLTYYDYFNLDGRHDWYNNFALALVYRPYEWMELAASWNYTLNRSNKDLFTYDTMLTGPSLALKMKF